jgi:Ca2+-binding RTX toxin-like protein
MTGATATAAISLVGSAGADLFRGSGAADSINGGAGDDRLDGGAGGDVITTGTGVDTLGLSSGGGNFARAGESVVASGQNLTTTIAAGQTLVFATGSAGNVDRVTDFVSSTDKMDVFNAGVAPTSLFGGSGTAALNNNQVYVLYGTYAAATGTFTVASGFVAGVTADAVVFQGNGTLSANDHTGTVVMIGLNQALVAADFV